MDEDALVDGSGKRRDRSEAELIEETELMDGRQARC